MNPALHFTEVPELRPQAIGRRHDEAPASHLGRLFLPLSVGTYPCGASFESSTIRGRYRNVRFYEMERTSESRLSAPGRVPNQPGVNLKRVAAQLCPAGADLDARCQDA
jgi:hypothetical protein